MTDVHNDNKLYQPLYHVKFALCVVNNHKLNGKERIRDVRIHTNLQRTHADFQMALNYKHSYAASEYDVKLLSTNTTVEHNIKLHRRLIYDN